ncbi:hypothetical protein DUNSADRAFT_17688 [Dunaliella salina]|uniref:Uncharacterized protein n=1 Tax=Dunaliella salina TaxID=3046 RepID=A0ABQ7G1C8_DUNSA|nr:hypothetical protein DUNSADRAFT_17688 [Dunaliella salina]|eukprot:KAF5828386.1 hypothetical protein DUNSADRAFT_17688 [Dunaliella salina]
MLKRTNPTSRCCEGRLLPTTWLNKLAHNDPLLLADVPYRYTLEYRSNDEAKFPELFKPQLQRREAKARKEAAEAHLAWQKQQLLLESDKEQRALAESKPQQLLGNIPF